MLQHFFHLALRSWFAMVAATSSNTLGVFVWGVLPALLAWLVAVAIVWFRLHKQEQGLPRSIWLAFRNSTAGLVGIGALFVIALVMWTVFTLRTVYYDHEHFVTLHAEDAQRIRDAEAKLAFYRSNISTQDPVFGNIIYLLQAFAVFRNGVHGESCVIRVTAPSESLPLASMVAQFSVATSNCATFGPDELFDRNPDLKTETLQGMVPDAIVFHAARDDKAANELFMRLSNLIKLVRSYDLPSTHDYQTPAGGYAHTVWLQFGSQVKWNGELMQH
jgi:hypothetical protein